MRVSGSDNAPTALKLTRQWLKQAGLTADLVLSDMRQPLPFRDNSFDALLSAQVIHHALLAAVLDTAREIERVVRTGWIDPGQRPHPESHLRGCAGA